MPPDRPGPAPAGLGTETEGRIGGSPVRGDDQAADELTAAAVLAKPVWQAQQHGTPELGDRASVKTDSERVRRVQSHGPLGNLKH